MRLRLMRLLLRVVVVLGRPYKREMIEAGLSHQLDVDGRLFTDADGYETLKAPWHS